MFVKPGMEDEKPANDTGEMTADEIDAAFSAYFDELYLSGDHVSVARKTLVAFMDFCPNRGG